MQRLPTFRQLLPVLGLVFHLLATISQAWAQPKRVLIVHSFGNAAPPFTTASTAFETTLTEEMGERVDLDEVSLDVARYASLDMEEALVELMRKRQARWQPDLVVPIGSPAGVFVARYRDRLFPATTPVIYTGMDQRRLPPGALEQNATFIGASYDLPGAVEDILQVAPGTTNIVVVIGATPLEQFWTDVLRREYQPFTNRVGFTWFNELSFDQMLQRSAKLPPHSFMLLILLMRDATGVTHNADEALRRIHEVANAPVNGLFRNQLGMGIVGGRLYADELEGAESARVAVRILRGEPASSFPPRLVPPSSPEYDWRELQRWNIGADLPPGSIVRFRESTVWERYKWRIIAIVSVCTAQALLISLLLANLVKRRRVERTLEESRNRLRSILDTAVEGIITTDERGVIESVNAATERIFGYTAAELIGRNFSMLMPRPCRDEHDQHTANQQGTPLPKFIGIGREVSGRRKDGSVFPMDLAVSEIVLADRRVFTGLVRDITERKQAEQTTRELTGRLITAQEAERARLARELHDDITQRLACLAIDAGRIESGRDGARPGEAMRDVRDRLVRLSEDVHSLSYKLHPALLEDLGLGDALKVECERFSHQESLPVEVKLEDIPVKLSPDTGLCLFRVTQEALRNVARHARANAAAVSLRPLEGGLQLAVTDTGVGFDLGQHRRRPSLGLASMRERVRLLGGELDIESAPGHGTSIVAWVPLAGKEP